MLERFLSAATQVRPPAGRPVLPRPLAELDALYDSCGGALIGAQGDYAWRLCAPAEVLPTNLLVLGHHPLGDRSDDWFTIAYRGSDWRLSIDLGEATTGRCYDSFHEIHGVAGSCPVIALSLFELLERLLADAGGYPYWLSPTFASYGDAYD